MSWPWPAVKQMQYMYSSSSIHPSLNVSLITLDVQINRFILKFFDDYHWLCIISVVLRNLHMYDFLLMLNGNLDPIWASFWDMIHGTLSDLWWTSKGHSRSKVLQPHERPCVTTYVWLMVTMSQDLVSASVFMSDVFQIFSPARSHYRIGLRVIYW